MKPPPLHYHRAESVSGAVRLLTRSGERPVVLAGGQSLVPALNRRELAPTDLVDITHVAALARTTKHRGCLFVGAAVRQAEAEHGTAARELPLLGQALELVATAEIRNRGTVVGSLVHGDPAAELPAVLRLTGGRLHIIGPHSGRVVSATEFLDAPRHERLDPGELVTAAEFPLLADHSGSAFVEEAPRAADRALCGAAAVVTLTSGHGATAVVSRAAVCLIAVARAPVLREVDGTLLGRPVAATAWAEAAHRACADLAPPSDQHADSAYRRHLAAVLAARALHTAGLRAAALQAADRRTPDHDAMEVA